MKSVKLVRDLFNNIFDMDRQQRHTLLGYSLITPAFIILFSVVVYPLVYNLILSFQKVDLIAPGEGTPFIGFANYVTVLTDPIFSQALFHTAIWVVSLVALEMLLGVTAAILLDRELRARGFMRGVMMIPWAVPGVVAAFTWRWMYDARFGILNHFLTEIGIIEESIAWLGNYNTALGAVIVPQVWKNFPFVMILTLAGLQSIPEELYEVAEVDGASFWQKLRHIILPMTKPTLMLASVLTTVWSFNAFSMLWILTSGGPAHASDILTTYVYKKAFRAFDLGQASATAVIMFLILLTFIIIYGRRVFQEGGSE